MDRIDEFAALWLYLLLEVVIAEMIDLLQSILRQGAHLIIFFSFFLQLVGALTK